MLHCRAVAWSNSPGLRSISAGAAAIACTTWTTPGKRWHQGGTTRLTLAQAEESECHTCGEHGEEDREHEDHAGQGMVAHKMPSASTTARACAA